MDNENIDVCWWQIAKLKVVDSDERFVFRYIVISPCLICDMNVTNNFFMRI